MMKYYYASGSIALASHIALCDAGAAFELHRIDNAAGQQKSPEYTALNPKARVPTLVTETGILTETPAILAYIAQNWPEAGLVPTDAFAFAKVQEFNSYICSTLHVAHAHRMRGYRWADEPEAIAAMQRKVPESTAACWRYLEDHVFAGPFAMGEQYTICDPYLFTVAQWMESDSVDPSLYPKIAAHRTMMHGRETVKAALAAEAS